MIQRRLALEGPVNFRDVGGYETTDGRTIRWGQLFRSDSLDSLTPADVARLEQLGVRFVCDLRRDEECATAPSRVLGHPSIRIEQLPVGGIAAETKSMAARMLRGEIPELGVEAMAQVYVTILDLHPDSFGTVVARASDPEALPMVVHCTAGKDRTGVATALILGALGVDDETIAADYELTTEFHSLAKIAEVRPQLEAAGIEFAKVEAYWSAPRAVMAAALEGIRQRWGGIDAYLRGPGGIDDDTLDRLRSNLLD